MRHPECRTQSGISRRDFLKQTAGAGVLLGAGALLPVPTPGDASAEATGRPTEPRTYFFDLSHIDTSNHDVVLVAGTQRVRLGRPRAGVLRWARRQHPILNVVPDAHLTHYAQNLPMPAQEIQLCYLQRIDREAEDGSWDMALLFYHHPTAGLLGARQRAKATAGGGRSPVPVKWGRYGLTAEARAALDDPVGEEMLQDTTSQAVAMVANHPELLAAEPTTAAHVQTNIIGIQPSTQLLGQVLADQGPATTSGGWATLTPLINPDTGQPYRNSQGQIQYMPQWSHETSLSAGAAMLPALDTVKDDPSLGVNITAIDPTTITTNDPDAPTSGALWTLHDGRPAVDQSPGGGLPGSGLGYQLTDQTPGHGYSLAVTGVDSTLNVSVEAKNWFLRYLGLYIRYLDANGQPIPLSTLANDIQDKFDFWQDGYNSEFDAFLDVVNPQFAVLCFPVQTTTIKKTFPLPPAATSALILAGGLGRGDNPYPATIGPGSKLTIVINLAIPAFFLALVAGSAYAIFVKQMQNAAIARFVIQAVVQMIEDEVVEQEYGSVNWKTLGVQLGQVLLRPAAVTLMQLVASSIATGETVERVTDAIPVVGVILDAVVAASLVAQIVETSVEVGTSPRTYVNELTFTHDIVVTIHHDPDDPAGFPATAASYTVTAQFDNGTPHIITRAMPGTTVSDPITATFSNVPFGGQVTVIVGFYSADGWLAGQGQIGPVPNGAGSCTTLGGSLVCQTSQTAGDLSLSFAITENLVPLTAKTTYNHKEIIALDANGRHAWQPTTTPPAEVTPQGLCENVNGQLCRLDGITISTVNAAVGYAWQAYNQALVDCASGATGQLHQFANLSVTQDPESGRLFSGCGFSGPVRVVYDLLGKQDWNFYLDPTPNLIRQIRLSGDTPSFDGPTSNQAWGRLQLLSDALLLHPAGKIISINSESDKIEVLALPAAAVPDDQAPTSQVYSGKGIREGRLQGPTLAALGPDGTILILETKNNRIQSFDLSANPKRHFKAGKYFVPLIDPPKSGVTYLDLAVEYSGYLYVLSFTGQPGSFVFRLDLYTPEGDWLARTTGVNAARLAVNYWRDLFTLNYQVLMLPGGSLPNVTEPSVSHWIPSTP